MHSSRASQGRQRKGPTVMAGAFDFASLRAAYRDGGSTPRDVVRTAYARIRADARPGLWISLRAEDEALALAELLEQQGPDTLPLYGIPFSVKDNIDVAGLETTAACPGYGYRPERSARVVAALQAKGAICLGKTNLDQFATGLNGTRSPYGPCGSAFDPLMVSGGSSSGSAVSVALQHVAFSIGTDTGGSGRIPAGLNNVVGLKPTLGTLSSAGLVPCCRTLDCPSVFAMSVEDAVEVAQAAFLPDPADASLRDDADRARYGIDPVPEGLTVLAPHPEQREFFGNAAGRALYEAALERLAGLGAQLRTIDYLPFLEAGNLVFDGPWIADRYASVGAFVDSHGDEVLPSVRAVLDKARGWSAADVFAAMARLRELKAKARAAFASGAVLALPTVAPLYSIAEMQADPITRNTHHGHYSYFANPLDLCAFSVPAGFYAGGMPFGITLFAPAFEDAKLAGLARLLVESEGAPLGTGRPA